MGIFETTGRHVDRNVKEAQRIGRGTVRDARDAELAAHAEIRALLIELEDSLHHGDDADLAALRERLGSQMELVRARFEEAQDNLRSRWVAAISATEQRIARQPWEALGAVAGVAFLLGVIVARS